MLVSEYKNRERLDDYRGFYIYKLSGVWLARASWMDSEFTKCMHADSKPLLRRMILNWWNLEGEDI